MKFEIRHRITGAVLFSLETESLKLCVEAAVKSGCDLREIDLSGSDLRESDLRGCDLRGCDLSGSDLRGSDLNGAKITNNTKITKAPIQIFGFTWPVTIWDQHMQIGCEFHSHKKWRNFTDGDWISMGGKDALKMKNTQFPAIIAICDAHRP